MGIETGIFVANEPGVQDRPRESRGMRIFMGMTHPFARLPGIRERAE
jgi:hypothetical protein